MVSAVDSGPSNTPTLRLTYRLQPWIDRSLLAAASRFKSAASASVLLFTACKCLTPHKRLDSTTLPHRPAEPETCSGFGLTQDERRPLGGACFLKIRGIG